MMSRSICVLLTRRCAWQIAANLQQWHMSATWTSHRLQKMNVFLLHSQYFSFSQLLPFSWLDVIQGNSSYTAWAPFSLPVMAGDCDHSRSQRQFIQTHGRWFKLTPPMLNRCGTARSLCNKKHGLIYTKETLKAVLWWNTGQKARQRLLLPELQLPVHLSNAMCHDNCKYVRCSYEETLCSFSG